MSLSVDRLKGMALGVRVLATAVGTTGWSLASRVGSNAFAIGQGLSRIPLKKWVIHLLLFPFSPGLASGIPHPFPRNAQSFRFCENALSLLQPSLNQCPTVKDMWKNLLKEGGAIYCLPREEESTFPNERSVLKIGRGPSGEFTALSFPKEMKGPLFEDLVLAFSGGWEEFDLLRKSRCATPLKEYIAALVRVSYKAAEVRRKTFAACGYEEASPLSSIKRFRAQNKGIWDKAARKYVRECVQLGCDKLD